MTRNPPHIAHLAPAVREPMLLRERIAKEMADAKPEHLGEEAQSIVAHQLHYYPGGGCTARMSRLIAARMTEWPLAWKDDYWRNWSPIDLLECFDWEATPDGLDFWSAVFDALEAGNVGIEVSEIPGAVDAAIAAVGVAHG